MTDTPLWQRQLQPPTGGLARLMRGVEARRARPPHARRGLMLAGAVAATMAAFGLVHYQRAAPQRSFERHFQEALAAEWRERGIARELPSTRADVRIVVLAPSTPADGGR